MAMISGAAGERVVNEVIQIIDDSNIFPNDYGFLKRVAIVESNMGLNPITCNGPSGDIWQVNRIDLMDTQVFWSSSGLKTIYPKIWERFGMAWPNVRYANLRKPLYSGLAARIFFANRPEAIPETLEGQAKFWEKYYNTSAGRRSEADFITLVQAFEGTN